MCFILEWGHTKGAIATAAADRAAAVSTAGVSVALSTELCCYASD